MKQLLIVLLTIAFIGCEIPDTETSDKKVSKQTEQLMTQSNQIVGMPNITNWNERKLVRDLYELRDTEGLQTYTYIIDMNGQRHFLGRSIGFGIPASVQYSNPIRTVDTWQSHGFIEQLPQPEPNGLFMPEGLSATWIFLLDGDGNPRPVYVEPQILVSPFPLH